MLGALCWIAEQRGCGIVRPSGGTTLMKGKIVPDTAIQEALEVCQTAIADSLFRFEGVAKVILTHLSHRRVRPSVAYRELQLAIDDFEAEELSHLRAYRAKISQILAEGDE
jgi:hypothetical protein